MRAPFFSAAVSMLALLTPSGIANAQENRADIPVDAIVQTNATSAVAPAEAIVETNGQTEIAPGSIVQRFEQAGECRDIPERFQACSANGLTLVQLSRAMFEITREAREGTSPPATPVYDDGPMPRTGLFRDVASLGLGTPGFPTPQTTRARQSQDCDEVGPVTVCEQGGGTNYRWGVLNVNESDSGSVTFPLGETGLGVGYIDTEGPDVVGLRWSWTPFQRNGP